MAPMRLQWVVECVIRRTGREPGTGIAEMEFVEETCVAMKHGTA